MKTQAIAIGSAVVLVAILVAAGGCQAIRAGYETASYRVIQADGAFQLREYPTLQWVETSMGTTSGDSDGSFGRLFRFITGGNQAQQKIAMTTPVYMTATATPGNSTQRVMAFVMPKDMVATAVPAPSDASVRRREVAAGRFAVRRFSGGRSSEREAEFLGELQGWVAARGLAVADPTPIYGYFDPPWTPSIFRRNEVMLRVSEPIAP
jgi:hypothetical protein